MFVGGPLAQVHIVWQALLVRLSVSGCSESSGLYEPWTGTEELLIATLISLPNPQNCFPADLARKQLEMLKHTGEAKPAL